KTPLLGLDVSLRNDAKLRQVFGLEGRRSNLGEVIWSPTLLETGRSASRSVHHGDFDDDPPTMNSVLRRVLGADDNDPIQEFPSVSGGAGGPSAWDEQVDWPGDLAFLFPPSTPSSVQPAPVMSAIPVTPPAPAVPPAVPVVTAGRRRALCIGINQY